MSIDDYPQNEKTRWEHLERIRQHLRFQQCDNFQRQSALEAPHPNAQVLPRSDALRQEAWRWLQEQRTPLLRRHLNPFGRYYYDLARMRQDGGQLVELPSEPSASERVGP